MLVAMTARRTRQFPPDYGLSSSFVEAVEVPELFEPARALLHRLQLSGMVEVEFKYDHRDRRYKLLDVNPRPWGWHALCIACGLDFPYMQYQDAVGAPVILPPPYVRKGEHLPPPLAGEGRGVGLAWRRLLTDVPAAMIEIRSGTLSPWAYLRSFGGRTVPSVFDVSDPLPALGDLAVAISRVLKRGRARPLTPSESVVTRPGARSVPIESPRTP
jgi:predicted ATP-grasp superfamily ATP-dependent carboligase